MVILQENIVPFEHGNVIECAFAIFVIARTWCPSSERVSANHKASFHTRIFLSEMLLLQFEWSSLKWNHIRPCVLFVRFCFNLPYYLQFPIILTRLVPYLYCCEWRHWVLPIATIIIILWFHCNTYIWHKFNICVRCNTAFIEALYSNRPNNIHLLLWFPTSI